MKDYQNGKEMRFKKGNRWRGNKGQVRYVCVKCNKKRKTTRVLHAHHIFSWNKFESKRYDRYNGVVLCIKCHNAFHRKYSYEALDKPGLLLEYLNNNRIVKQYIQE